AKTLVAPLDRVKILFQTSNPQFHSYANHPFGVVRAMNIIYHQDGSRGLFRGHSATLLRIFPYAAVKFLAYEQFRAVFIPDKQHETPWRRLISGSLA
ncbi:coenzyme A transporter, partial [Trichoglossum hirsutum]